MLSRNRLVRMLLAMAAGALALYVVLGLTSTPLRAAAASEAQSLRFQGHTTALACSSDGRVVYAADGEDVYRSLDFGRPGSWEHVLK